MNDSTKDITSKSSLVSDTRRKVGEAILNYEIARGLAESLRDQRRAHQRLNQAILDIAKQDGLEATFAAFDSSARPSCSLREIKTPMVDRG